jgi:glycosyltransferase involved in cell wall biosynthesis
LRDADSPVWLAEAFASSRGAVTSSDALADWVRRLAPPGFPIVVESNAAGPAFFHAPSSADVQRVLHELRLTPHEFRVGFVGSLQPWHDLTTLVDAVAALDRVTPSRLVLAGEGPLRNELLRQAWERQVRLTLCGPLSHDDVPACLSLLDVVVIPSLRTDALSSPIKLFEAMAAARAIVATATEPLRRVVEHDRHALLVPPTDAVAMADALRTLRADPARRFRLGAEARRAAECQHTWDAVATRVLAFARQAGEAQTESCSN